MAASSARPPVPPGYLAFSLGGLEAVCVDGLAPLVRSALAAGTLHEYARSHGEATPLAGRTTAYAAPLPDGGPRVVVRHNQHGGMLAPVTRDLFAPPTRAPRELAVSLRLREAGVPTPELIAYATYPAFAGLRRADVATIEVTGGFDLGLVLEKSDDALRAQAWEAVGELLFRLDAAGARHHDLNVKNVLLRPRDGALEAMVLDVDRVTFEAGGVMPANVERLARSARKRRDRYGATLDESELTALSRAVAEPRPRATARS